MGVHWVDNKTKGQMSTSLITQGQLTLLLTVLTLVLAMVLSEAALVNAELTVLIDICNQ